MAREITVLTTGGTIATSQHYGRRRLGAKDLAHIIEKHLQQKNYSINWREFRNVPSTGLSLLDILSLLEEAENEIARGCDAVVITHGTDVLEETAYLFSLFWQYRQPVVITGAMRSSDTVGADGTRNLLASILTVTSKKSWGRGPLVIFNDRIYAAAEVTKTHSWATDTFKTELGPLGTINQWNVINFNRKTNLSERLPRPSSLKEPTGLITASVDTSGEMIEAAVAGGFRGLVIEGAGRGSMNQQMQNAAKEAASQGVFIVVASRCTFGGTAHGSISRRIIKAGNLSGVKARLLLKVAMNLYGSNENKIRELFDSC